MATLHSKTTGVSTRSASRQSQLVAAKPLASKFCFQSCSRQQIGQATTVRGARQVVSVAQVEQATSPELELPAGYHWYETCLILKPTLSNDERDRELAKFEAYLNKEGCQNINALAKNMPTRLAYPIKNEYEGIYVLYTYAAKRQTAKAVQLLLSNPEAGSEDKLLRHITLCKM